MLVRLVTSLLLCLAVAAPGCGAGRRPEIIESLRSRDKNVVHVALWTLRQGGVAVPRQIALDRPYRASEPHLRELVRRLSRLDAAELEALDRSLRYHRRIYSPIWGPGSDRWR
jgi:hypothetical protein